MRLTLRPIAPHWRSMPAQSPQPAGAIPSVGAPPTLTRAEIQALGKPALRERIAQLADKDPGAARALCREAIKVFPEHEPFHALRGVLLINAELWDKAEQALQQAIELNPKKPKYPVHLARIRVRQGRFAEASALLKAAIALPRADAWIARELAQHGLFLRDFEMTTQMLAPPDAASDPELQALMDRAREGLAADAFAGVPPYARRKVQLAMEMLRRGDPAAAEARIAPVVTQHPRLAEAWLTLRGALSAQGQAAKAAELASAWAAAAPDADPVMRAMMARALSPRGLLFDPRERFPLVRKEDALRRAATPSELQDGPDSYFVIDPGGREIRHQPVISLTDDGSDADAVEARTSPSFVLSLANAAVADRGVALTASNQVIDESLLLEWGVKCHSAKQRGGLQFDPWHFADGGGPVTYFDTPAFLMAGPTDLHFGDWTYNFLPRLQLAEAAGLDVPLVVNADIPARYVDMLEALGAPRSRLIFRDPASLSVFPRLYVPSWPSRDRLEPMEGQYGVYARAAGKAHRDPRERLFLSRRNFSKRGLINEREIRDIFAARGFRIVCPEEESFPQSLETFARAACVAGPYGSAFRNLHFTHEPPPAFVLMAPDSPRFVRGTVLWFAQAGVRFGYVRGRPAPGFEEANPRLSPWTIDPEEVAAKLDRFLAALEA